MAAADGKDAASGALGGVVGEVAAEALSKDLKNKIFTGKIEPQDIQSWVNLGVDLSKLAAGLAAAATGGDVNTAAQTGGNAAQNNAFLAWINDVNMRRKPGQKEEPNPKPEDLKQKAQDFVNRVEQELPDSFTYNINSGLRPGDSGAHGEGRGIDINMVDGISMRDFGLLSDAALVAKYGQEKVQQLRQAADDLVNLAKGTGGVNQIIGPTGGWDRKDGKWVQMDPTSTTPRRPGSSVSDADLIRTHKNHFHINVFR